ncbi:MAG: hypothetical protein V7L30_32615, partial [Nostoc sp.]|uniref:hypothetical protein n=1 Tax=Nostoc sp. TaxID=1180 RepID=UPI002FF7231B
SGDRVMAGKIKLKIGNSVIVKPSVLDPDLGTEMSVSLFKPTQSQVSTHFYDIEWVSKIVGQCHHK